VGIVAAENFYADVARQIGGSFVTVTSILGNPDQDPHLFEASPSVARSLSGAGIVVYNGAAYDPWMGKLLSAAARAGRQSVVAAELTGRKAGDNPHLWYDPPTMPAVSRALAAALSRADPAHAPVYSANLERFLRSLDPINAKISSLRARYAGMPVTATEPVFGYMAAAIGLDMRNGRFQLAVMNDAEPAASDVAAMEDDLRRHRVRLFIYNRQASNSAATRLLRIAQAGKIPVLGVTETEPRDARSFQDWILGQLDTLDHLLSASPT
jgi:zinc/manganese transport system substrate-binding protein